MYWYNGYIVNSEIARGLDIFDLKPSPFLTENEIAAAKTVQWDYLNAQGQPKAVWPATFHLAKALTDQLDRDGSLSNEYLAQLRQIIANAEYNENTTDVVMDATDELLLIEMQSQDKEKVEMIRLTLLEIAGIQRI